MNILTDGLPVYLDVCGSKKRIYTDFREFIEMDRVIREGTEEQASLFILSLFCDEVKPDECISAFDALFKFMYPDEKYSDSGKGQAGGGKPVFSFDDDAPFILSDFRRYYGIDLIHIPYLHWYEFTALLEGLPDESSVKTRIAYRSINLAEIKDKEERKRIRKIKNYLRIKTGTSKYISDEEIGAAFS